MHYLNHFSTDYIEELLDNYRKHPETLDPSWRFFFDGLSLASDNEQKSQPAALPTQELEFEIKVLELIQNYRDLAYLIADVNPLDRTPKNHPLLELKAFGLSESDLSRKTRLGRLVGLGDATLREIITALKTCYCSPAAVETSHIEDPKSRHWVQTLVESRFLLKPLETSAKKNALQKITDAESFERFIHKKFVGAKRFSLEGNDVLIPMLDYLIEQATAMGVDEIIFGMAHRGRINVLANIFQKDIRSMFAEFSGNLAPVTEPGDGDVKYHMGYSLDYKTRAGHDVHLSLAPNPSHLEAVNAVVMGMARSKQKLKNDHDRSRTLVVLMHGDASFAGQGSIYELLNMSGLPGYNIGGIIHIVTNNQVGFTTDPSDGRSTNNATDIARMLQAPIFRVNADEVEAALRTIDLSVQYRQNFKRDVFIDLLGYRRYGHNEGDEPTFTQPAMYTKIVKHPTAREQYAAKLVSENLMTTLDTQNLVDGLMTKFDEALEETRKSKFSVKMTAFGKRWEGFDAIPKADGIFKSVKTAVDLGTLQEIGQAIVMTPENFNVHPKIKRLLDDRGEMATGKRAIDWGMGESFAFGSILKEGFAVRLAGQDVRRGTFSHRHAVYFDAVNGSQHVPLNTFKKDNIDIEFVNSLLSEYAALGFELGQSWANPKKLTLWEAQFGDFVNGAQIILDQFLASASFKWNRYSGLVLLLPHGYEGQGPEHSSSRFERFLQACAQNNMQVVNLTTPAQYFHVLRRQILRPFRIPLIVISPKSLLRHPHAVSKLEDFTNGTFNEILDDGDDKQKKSAKRIVFCTGKIYYELLKAREALTLKDTLIVRIEQLYPFHKKAIEDVLAASPKATDIVWCQEEPRNMGAFWYMTQNLQPLLSGKNILRYVGRPEQASPAHGYMHVHQEEQEKIVTEALSGKN